MPDPSALDPAARTSEAQGIDRFGAFANYFKAYMGKASVVTACLPIPVSKLNLIPTYAAHLKFLPVFTSLFCFLMLSYLFYIRHSLAKLMFYGQEKGRPWLCNLIVALPLLLTIGCFCLVVLYFHVMDSSLSVLCLEQGVSNGTSDILRITDIREIPYGLELIVLYVAMFVTAETAFTLMALREYLQDAFKIDDAAQV